MSIVALRSESLQQGTNKYQVKTRINLPSEYNIFSLSYLCVVLCFLWAHLSIVIRADNGPSLMISLPLWTIPKYPTSPRVVIGSYILG